MGKKKKRSSLKNIRGLGKKRKKPKVVKRVSDRKRIGNIKDAKKDKSRKALPPGWRISKNGNLYYEARRNRSDVGRV